VRFQSQPATRERRELARECFFAFMKSGIVVAIREVAVKESFRGAFVHEIPGDERIVPSLSLILTIPD
jgi:hypothetical protein